MYLDLSGSRLTKSTGVARYIVPVKDDCSRFRWTYFHANKSAGNAAAALGHFLAYLCCSGTPFTVERFRSDYGGEFAGESLKELCDERAI